MRYTVKAVREDLATHGIHETNDRVAAYDLAKGYAARPQQRDMAAYAIVENGALGSRVVALYWVQGRVPIYMETIRRYSSPPEPLAMGGNRVHA
jgi:hypothetical protein